MIDVIVSGGLNLTVEDTGDIINVTVEVAAPIAVEVVVGIPTKEGIVGLAKSDTPEFDDVVIPEIAEETSYTASAWAWLTGLFGAVTGSVKAMLVGLVEGVASLDERVEGLESNVIADITLSSNVIALDINLPTLEYDIEIEVNYTSNTDSATLFFRVNGVIGSSYVMATSQTYPGFISYTGRHAAKGIYRLTLIDGFIFCQTTIQQIWGTESVQNVSHRVVSGYLKDIQEGINLISFEHQINANSRFIVRRVKKHD